ncbi:MAG TPA: hypothetical protein VHS58_08550, partial [Acetobacteraceae bacterium]|nr:hypothetical protein [Acetobacteraceae bacterium]
MPDDTLHLQVGNYVLSGWQRVSVTRSMDQIPANFDLEVTERYPDSPDIDIKPGQSCTVWIGGDLVITGYVDRYAATVNAAEHTIRVQGRSKSADLTDCSAFTGSLAAPDMRVKNSTALGIARTLAAPYGVTIDSIAGNGFDAQQFNINVGETAWDVIDRLVRVSGFVAYDMPDGSVRLARAGTETMASGFTLGVNCETADIAYSMDQRYSEYIPTFLSVVALSEEAGGSAVTSAGQTQHDAEVPRFRRRFVVSEQVGPGIKLAEQRAAWEKNRRYGRSQQFNVTCDSWRDSAGNLWQPNHLAPISAPQIKLANATWCIGGVTYVRDEHGQHAQLLLMPKEAFTPEPAILNPLPPLQADMDRNNPTKPNPPPPAEKP